MMPRERPIIFDAESVRAILAGRKTQTRRLMDIQRPESDWHCVGVRDSGAHVGPGERALARFEDPLRPALPPHYVECPFGLVGERLWVREAFGVTAQIPLSAWEHTYKPLGVWQPGVMAYRADRVEGYWFWHSPIFMPHWASRITLEVTEVRAERLQEITLGDVAAEGWPGAPREDAAWLPEIPAMQNVGFKWFQGRWDALNAKRGHEWESNPWVWVVTFRRSEVP